MKNATCLTDDQRWQSVLARDPNADGEFVFAVRTTGIFCRPVLPRQTCLAGKCLLLRKCQRGARRRISPLQTLSARQSQSPATSVG
ncbi:regulatory protein of adaptative response [Escherichia coli]|uniref:Regulatory protein of adaptative response n=1 Tax=Escherichia coli TaxID=562 RepID=A0A377D068_ECOLX|nr:regulatory protein of adaptative response [Escherichia coli]